MEIPFLNEGVIVALGTGIGVVLTKLVDMFRAKKGEDREDKRSDADIESDRTAQALGIYQSLVEGLRADMKEMLGYLHQLEKDHLACREENAALRSEVKSLTARVKSLEEAPAK